MFLAPSDVLNMLVIEYFRLTVANMISGNTQPSHSNSPSPHFFPLFHLFEYLSAELCITSSHPAAKRPAPPGLSTTHLACVPQGKGEEQYCKHKNCTKAGTTDHRINSSLKLHHPEQLVFLKITPDVDIFHVPKLLQLPILILHLTKATIALN